MTKFFIIHGTMGNPKENWFPWLKQELENLGHTVLVPTFPTPEGQSLDNWMEVFDETLVDKETIFIGHSLGPAFILSILEKRPCKACFFVSGFLGLLGNSEFDELNKTFTTKEFDWDKIKQNCKKFFVFNSDNDPFIPIERGKQLADKLNTELIIIKNAGHINAEAGYTKFPQLLEVLSESIL